MTRTRINHRSQDASTPSIKVVPLPAPLLDKEGRGEVLPNLKNPSRSPLGNGRRKQDNLFGNGNMAAASTPARRTPFANRGRNSPAAYLVVVSTFLLTGCASISPKADLVYFPSSATARVVHLKSFNRLSSLVPKPRSLTLGLRGEPFSPYVLSPAGVAYDEGRLFVCDTGLGVVHEWNLATGKARRLGESGEIILQTPVAVCVDDDHNVYVADTGRGEVIRFSSSDDGNRRYRPADREGFRPVGVACHEGTLYAADAAQAQIERFSISRGTPLAPLVPTDAEGKLRALPIDVAVDAQGTLYVSDMMGGRVLAYTRTGKFLRAISQRGDRYGDMGQPKHVAIAPDGTILVSDAEFGHVHLFNQEGKFLMLIGSADDRPGGTPMPFGIAVAASVPDQIAALVPDDFAAEYFFFVTNSVGSRRISLFAAGQAR